MQNICIHKPFISKSLQLWQHLMIMDFFKQKINFTYRSYTSTPINMHMYMHKNQYSSKVYLNQY